MNGTAPDRLLALLDRALARAKHAQDAKRHIRNRSEEKRISEAYATILELKANYRRLLAAEAQDGMRFRWYFTNVKQDTPLDELRAWIDGKIAKEQ